MPFRSDYGDMSPALQNAFDLMTASPAPLFIYWMKRRSCKISWQKNIPVFDQRPTWFLGESVFLDWRLSPLAVRNTSRHGFVKTQIHMREPYHPHDPAARINAGLSVNLRGLAAKQSQYGPKVRIFPGAWDTKFWIFNGKPVPGTMDAKVEVGMARSWPWYSSGAAQGPKVYLWRNSYFQLVKGDAAEKNFSRKAGQNNATH